MAVCMEVALLCWQAEKECCVVWLILSIDVVTHLQGH